MTPRMPNKSVNFGRYDQALLALLTNELKRS